MRFAPLALIAACLLTLSFGLDSVGYLDQREARDAQVTEEMRAAKEWLTPVFGHEPLFDHPVAGYLPELLAHDRETESPVASRLLRAALAALLVVLTWRIGARHLGARAGASAGLVLATTLVLPLAARTDGAQLLGTLAAWVAIAGFARATFGPLAGARRLLISHAALAAACLMAGPLPALWPLAGVALYSRLSGRRELLSAIRPLPALVLIAGISLPWYGAMTERHGVGFLTHAIRFPYGAGPAGPWFSGVLLTISFLVAGAFPWSALLPAAFAHSAMRWRRIQHAGRAPLAEADRESLAREAHEERVSHFFIACLVAALAPIAFYPTPPLPAALPALPAVALLCGRFLDHLIEAPDRLRGVFSRSTLMLGLIGTVVAIAFSTAGSAATALFPALRWVAPFALLSGWAPFLAHFFLRRTRVAAALIAVPVALGTPLVVLRLLPELEDFMSARTVATAMNAVSPPEAPLVILDPPPATLRLFLARNAVLVDSLPAGLGSLRSADGEVYLAVSPAREREAARKLEAPIEIMARTPALALARVRWGGAPAADSTR